MAPTAGFVVTALPWHPDMVVRVNGRTVPAERVNYAFLGFEVQPGRREIQITFVPRMVFVGGLVSGGSLLIWSALLVGMWRSGRGSSTDDSTETPMPNLPRLNS